MTTNVELTENEADDLALKACLGAGANHASARSLVDATLSAASIGSASVGFPHLVDYLNSFRAGRINCNPSPKLTRPFPAYIASDADQGVAQLGFDLGFTDLITAARTFGMAIFSQKNSYTTGELGYYVRRLAGEGIVGVAATNASAMVAVKAGSPAVFSTNPMAFGFPLGGDHPPLVIDQSTSATAYVNIVAAAKEGRLIPEGWAVDASGADTTDATQALAGALLPFGGRRGANIGLFVEMLSAGLSGGNWSLDASSFNSGEDSPAVGLTVVAIMPGASPQAHIDRARNHIDRLQKLGIYVPGVSAREDRQRAPKHFRIASADFEILGKFASVAPLSN